MRGASAAHWVDSGFVIDLTLFIAAARTEGNQLVSANPEPDCYAHMCI